MVRLMMAHMWKSNRGGMCLVQRKVSKRDHLQEVEDDAKLLAC
jgi:hypothetical protein